MSAPQAHLSPLAGFASVIELPVAWGEMDAFGHVNNIYYFRYFESGRLDYFTRIGYLEHAKRTGVGPILASTQCTFRRPLAYPDTVSVGTRISRIEPDRFLMEYRLISRALGQLAAEGQGLLVSYDYGHGQKAPLPEVIRRAIEALEGKSLSNA